MTQTTPHSKREIVARKLNPWAFGIVANIQHTEMAASQREAAYKLADEIIAALSPLEASVSVGLKGE